MRVVMLPTAGEFEHHKGERFETDGTVYNVCGTECYLLKGYGLFAIDQLKVVDEWMALESAAGLSAARQSLRLST